MQQSIKKAIIPAAGLGTRLLPATKSQPKEMLPVGRKPVLQYVVEELQAAGLAQLLMITGRRKRTIEDHFDADPQLVAALKQAGNEKLLADLAYIEDEARFFYTRQSEAKGLGHAVSLGRDFIDHDDFVVALGDSLIAGEEPAALLKGMCAAHQELKAAAVIAVEQVPAEDVSRYGIVSIKENAVQASQAIRVDDIIEKPAPGAAPSRLAVAARYVFSPQIFDALERTPPDHYGEIQLTNAIQTLVKLGAPVYAWVLPENQRRYDVGNFESYFQAFIDFALADERYGYLVRKYIKAKAYEL